MVVTQRRPYNVIHHVDQGSQHTSLAFGSRCQEADVRPSMRSVGDANDNAMAESFFSTLESEMLALPPFPLAGQGTDGLLQLHQGLLQIAALVLGARITLANRLRARDPTRTITRDPA